MTFIVSFNTEQGWLHLNTETEKAACLSANIISESIGEQNVVVKIIKQSSLN